MIFSLTLSYELTYREDAVSFETIDSMPVGSETCFAYDFRFDDVFIRTDLIWSGTRKPLTNKEKEIIESGFPPLPRDDEHLFIPAGKYTLLQSVPVRLESELARHILPFTSTRQEGRVYVRFIKENELECVMQLFFPA